MIFYNRFIIHRIIVHRSNRKNLRPCLFQPRHHHEPRDQHGGEKRADDADGERDREALDRAGTEEIEDQRRRQRRHVAVENGAKGKAETILDGLVG